MFTESDMAFVFRNVFCLPGPVLAAVGKSYEENVVQPSRAYRLSGVPVFWHHHLCLPYPKSTSEHQQGKTVFPPPTATGSHENCSFLGSRNAQYVG